MKRLFFALAIGLVAGGLGLVYSTAYVAAFDGTGCLNCHGNPNLTKFTEQEGKTSLYVDGEALNTSVHGSLGCTTCHTTFNFNSLLHPASNITPLTKLSLTEKCGSCHQLQSTQYLGSTHGASLAGGNTDVASCADCHNAGEDTHNIVSVSALDSPVYITSIAQTCATCHDDEELMARYDISDTVYETYNNFFHSKAMSLATDEQIARMNYATCTSCHGSHDILAADDPSSPVATLTSTAETCATCHDGATTEFAASYHMHKEASTEHQVPTFIANVFYAYILIPAMVVFGTSFIILDLIRSLRQRRRRKDDKE